MRFYYQIMSIVLFLLILVQLTIPIQPGMFSYILKGTIIGLLSIVTFNFFFSNNNFTPVGNVISKIRTTRSDKDIAMSDSIEDHYRKLLINVLNSVESIHPEYVAGVYMADPGSGGYTLQESTGNIFKNFVDAENKLIKLIFHEKKVAPIRRQNIVEEWDEMFEKRTWRGSEALIAIPIAFRGRNSGCLIVLAYHFSQIQDRDKKILTQLVQFISAGMDELEKFENLRLDNYFQVRVTHLFDQLKIASDESKFFESIRGLCRSFFQYDKLTISLTKNQKNTLQIKMVDGMREDADIEMDFLIDQTLHGLAILKGKTIRSENWIEEYPYLNRFLNQDRGKFDFKSILSTPIRTNGEIRGVLTLERLKPIIYTDSDKHFIEMVAGAMGSLLSWMEDYKIMHINSIHDGLTNLLNHKAFMDRFEEEINRAKRFDQMMTCIVLDLDKFKNVNDSYGHLYGDYVLKQVAKIIKESVRTIDVVGRYGGEEFAVLLVSTDISHALPVADRIVRNIAEYNFFHEGIGIHVTISAGMVGFPIDATKVRDLISKADKAMYQSKENGRNQVTIYAT